MSVMMTMRVAGDAAKVEHEDRAMMQSIVAKAKQHGLVSHHFYGSDTEILVVDEWPDEESFRRFFEASPEIAGIIERSGARAEPEITFWRTLDTGDAVG
jgi:heme-degrading monooxygenase HmoA